MMAASEGHKAAYAGKLRQHLDAFKEELRDQAAGTDPTNLPTSENGTALWSSCRSIS